MIFVERGQAPDFLKSTEVEKERLAMKNFYKKPRDERNQLKFSSRLLRSKDLRNHIIEVFNNKCVYCESVLLFESSVIDNFRPRAGARNEDGTVAYDYYYWLTNEWFNLYLSCQVCNKYKSNRFPIKGHRAKIGTLDYKTLLNEEPLLLDPCYDNPEEYLIYTEEGLVLSNYEKGLYTIDIIGLNRHPLVQARKHAFLRLRHFWDFFSHAFQGGEKNSDSLKNLINELSKLISPFEEYSAVNRQFLRLWISEKPNISEYLQKTDSKFSLLFFNTSAVHTPEEINTSLVRLKEHEKQVDKYDLRKKQDRSKYFRKQRHINRIVLSNFRSIGSLDLQVTNQTEKAPWLMLLGENGTGKSSVLQAVALALMDEETRRKHVKDASKYLKFGESNGFVKVFLSGSSQPITLNFSKGSKNFSGRNHLLQKVLLLGYGSTRLLPSNRARKKHQLDFVRVDNLFNPLNMLANASKFLYELDDENFTSAANTLKSLLLLEEATIIRKKSKKNKIFVKYSNYEVTLEQLSDGYRSVVALIVDILMVLFSVKWKNLDAEAIVLIDELDAHLHPQWILQIVSRLREVFPLVQFIVTSHNPLCLRGLKQEEIVVLRRGNNQEVFVYDELPPQEILEVDTLLTSNFFGLNDTMDPETNRDFERYYLLTSKKSLSVEEEGELVVYKRKFLENRLLGKSKREQIMYDIIDKYVANEKYNQSENLKELKEETQEKLIEILKSVNFLEGPPDDTY
ncbi:AAA family ATPase [Bacillus sp. AFS017274]|uniref:AAA family ATPase n=1 Tax=Bacillus sp. AFS017274 TaxID=2033488 RepID=UPI000BF77F01|nr:AAA family ATPase [Bacillus sp. AFS017274]PEZ76348.1 hypothetical protein CN380_21380 [Bacillus sp. AFS017274]